MSVVLDANVVIALVVADERQGAVRTQLERWLEAGEELHAPGVLPYEVAAVTSQLRRRHATDSTYVSLARRLGTVVWTLDGALARNAADVGLPVRLVA